MNDSEEPFGWSVSIDLYDCDVALLESAKHIERFAVELCDDVLKMKRFGPAHVEWFGEAHPKTAGYSLVQLIETSSVVGHFSGDRASAHLDVFSCAPYDVATVRAFCEQYFHASRSNAVDVRRA